MIHLLFLLFGLSQITYAQSPWLNANQQGLRSFQNQDYDQAKEEFSDTRWKAASAFNAQKYEEAAQLLEAYDDVDAHYNRANALAYQGNLEAALAAYDQALTLNPDHAQSKQNRALVEEWLQQTNENQNNQDQTGENQDNQQGENQEGQSQEGQNQQNQSQSTNQSENESASESANEDEGKDEGEDEGDSTSATNEATAEEKTNSEAFKQALEEENEHHNNNEETPEAENANPTDSASQGNPAQMIQQLDPETVDLQRWLQYVDDAPGELLKRKFEYEAKQHKAEGGQHDEEYW